MDNAIASMSTYFPIEITTFVFLICYFCYTLVLIEEKALLLDLLIIRGMLKYLSYCWVILVAPKRCYFIFCTGIYISAKHNYYFFGINYFTRSFTINFQQLLNLSVRCHICFVEYNSIIRKYHIVHRRNTRTNFDTMHSILSH